MPSVVNCPDCGRPNGVRFRKCMYCSAELPKVEESSDGEEVSGTDRLTQALDPSLMASLPPGLRTQLGAMSAKKAAAPLPPESPLVKVELPPTLAESLESISAELTPLDDAVSYDETLNGLAVESLIAEIEQDDPTSMPEPTALEEPLDLEPLPFSSIQEQYVSDVGPHRSLLRGRGPWGPRDAQARLLLLPDPTYRQRLPWLRARLHNLLGLDAYTATLYLQRTFPVYLQQFDSPEEAEELAGELDRGGLGALVLTRTMVQSHPRAIVVRRVVVEDELLLFILDGEGEELLTVPKGALEAAFTAEIKPVEDQEKPLMERSFWRNTPRPSLSFEEVGSPYWVLDLVTSDTIVRVRADEFDFSCLGKDRGPSTLFNLRTLPQALSGRELVADDLFKRVPQVKREAIPEADEAPDEPSEEVTLFDEYVMIQTVSRRSLTRGG